MPQGDESETMIVALAGGVGAAKFLRGLVAVMPPEELTIISNTGDDINLFGLHISPDIDIVAYTLSGLVDDTRGWGIQGDTFHSLAMLRHYGAPSWFNLGDRDLATHILRTQRLHAGESLTSITTALCQALGLTVRMLPMCDQPVPSLVRTPAGTFHFQEYLVQRGGQEEVLDVIYQDVAQARPSPEVLEAHPSGHSHSHLSKQPGHQYWPDPGCAWSASGHPGQPGTSSSSEPDHSGCYPQRASR